MKTYHVHNSFSLPGWIPLTMALVLLVHASGCSSTKPGKVALTAEITAGLRAVAAMEPDEKIRNPDYLAERLLTPAFWFYGPFRKDFETSKQYINFYRVSGYYTANACTKHIDSILINLARHDLKQVVNIGAGLDSRPYRLQKKIPGVSFFEIDRPGALAHKKERVKAVLGEIPSEVVYIPLDYHTQKIDSALKKAGYKETLKTLFIMEGVTAYIDEAAVDNTLRFIALHSAPGSEVVFDYILDDLVRGNFKKFPRAQFYAVRRSTSGEPWKFGIPEGRADDFVTQRGLKAISDYGPDELARQYLVRSDGALDGQPSAFVRIMHAGVPR